MADNSDFWDILAPKEKSYAPPKQRDISAEMITDEGDGHSVSSGKRIEDSFAASGAPRSARPDSTPPFHSRSSASDIPHQSFPRSRYSSVRSEDSLKEAERKNKVLLDYKPENSLVKHVTVTLWPSSFNYYERFRRNALKSHALVGKESPRVPYSSYIPQYAQLTRQQVDYYLWFRDSARQDKFLDADFSYVLLYIYEIINLPDVIPKEDALTMLTKLWLVYRKRYIQLDKYMSEWLCDFCLVNQLRLPNAVLAGVPQILTKASFKEFYLSAMLSRSGLSPDTLGKNSRALATLLISSASDYDFKLGKYFAEHSEEMTKHITGAVAYMLGKLYENGDRIVEEDMRPMRLSRDAFCGSLCSLNAKKRIDVEYISFARSYPLKSQLTAAVKYAENKVRAMLKLKSRLACGTLDVKYKALIDEYFAPFSRRVPTKIEAEVPDYEKLYDAPATPLSFESAAEIERSSWKVTDILVESSVELEAEPDFIPEDISCGDAADSEAEVSDGSANDFRQSDSQETAEYLPPELEGALKAALDGDFSGYCRANHMFPDDAVGKINDFFADRIGDIVLISDGGGYSVIDDYRSDIEEWIRK